MIRRYLKIIAAGAMALALAGCEEKSKVTKEKTVTTPGGSTTIKEERSIEQKGDNPPSATSTQPGAPSDSR